MRDNYERFRYIYIYTNFVYTKYIYVYIHNFVYTYFL